jgi:hypothetical protein
VLRGGPLGRAWYLPAAEVREDSASTSISSSSSSDHTAVLLAAGGQAAVGLWSQLAGRSWLVRLATSAEPPFARHTCSGSSCELAGTAAAPPAAPAVVAVAERCSLHSTTATTATSATASAAAVSCDPFSACLFEHMCRNALLRRLHIPHRFLALVQVELRDLKNLSPHFAASPMDVYAAVRLKRSSGIDPAAPTHSTNNSSSSSGGGTAAAASSKHVPLGTAITEVRRVVPSAEAGAGRHWGGAAVFRFPLPEDASSSIDALGAGAFAQALELYQQQQQQQSSSTCSSTLPPAGPPSVLQLIVHRKHLLADDCLGAAEVPLHSLSDDVQLDEWVPLKQVGVTL